MFVLMLFKKKIYIMFYFRILDSNYTKVNRKWQEVAFVIWTTDKWDGTYLVSNI